MAVLTWGNPSIEFGTSSVVDNAQAVATWQKLQARIVNGSSKLTTTAGNKTEAKDEGGAVVDSRREASNYSFEFEVYGDNNEIADINGVITTSYGVRLTPEDTSLSGWQMLNTSVSKELTWSATDGTKTKYIFDGLLPAEGGKILKPYTQQ